MKIIPAKDQRTLDNEEINGLPVTAYLPVMHKQPHFTTYVHTTRNQKMSEGQSVKGKRRIYYDQIGGEAMVYPDHNEEQNSAPCEEKHEFSEVEKRIIRMASQDQEPSESVIQTLAWAIGRTTSEIQEELGRLKKKDKEVVNQNAIDASFCRRCLEFGCKLYGNDQPVITLEQETLASSSGRNGARKVARIGLGDAIVLRVNAEASSAHVLKPVVNVTPISVEIVDCGGGPLGEPQSKGEGQCGNMRFLQRKKQRILMGVSDVAGWGTFVRHAVERDEFLGEYTGELISHEEADLRGVLYDRANSYLCNLNDKFVIDSYRQGNKLKFANHSTNPNCYARVIKVGGEDRTGILTKKRIEEGEEIFLDYCYDPEHSFPWTRKPEDATDQKRHNRYVYRFIDDTKDIFQLLTVI
ncbi:uncharacterized protein LOC143544810 [Bidens hawaiensis]|uniref:uncharacterized protein LOC143544810 n=1 Tax=Bidens hawaiensis TaxID=980011 RepID=UPI00404A70D2